MRLLLLAAVTCLTVVVVTHVAEWFHFFPAMGWGLPNSPGHYLDLTSAVLGIALSVAALITWAIRRLRGAGRKFRRDRIRDGTSLTVV
jgi:hypothetical protein